ncbi:hypothetical protein E2C01_066790 [Portunus trituberculatus]|uniref:Uncharacterized protein n=1 Tax=Portunus trituberculatus TaxID=210409 RepID=A0A5B7HI34_PORTR|nr:hypothetical protein [Portunus trituberculatus]
MPWDVLVRAGVQGCFFSFLLSTVLSSALLSPPRSLDGLAKATTSQKLSMSAGQGTERVDGVGADNILHPLSCPTPFNLLLCSYLALCHR